MILSLARDLVVRVRGFSEVTVGMTRSSGWDVSVMVCSWVGLALRMSLRKR